MKLLITGGHGMVGRNLLETRKILNHDVLAPAREEMNLSSILSVRSYLKFHMPDLIIHAAGRVGGIQANLKFPVNFMIDNIDINRNLIGVAQELGIKRLLNLGSSCMYPRDAENPLKESMILHGELEPTNEGYAIAKIMAQRLCEYIMREDSSYQYKTLIPCNLFGRFDKFSPEHSHLVPAVIRKIHEAVESKLEKVEIWGDGLSRREFMYAGDLAEFIGEAVEKFDSLPNLMNVGTGVDYTVNEYYEAIAKVLGFAGTFMHDLTKPVGMRRKLVSTDRADKWGWSSKTDLQTGIRKTYDYFRTIEI